MKNTDYRRLIYFGIIIISLGIVMNTTLEAGSIGRVFIGVGGLFFIAGMAKKRKEGEEEE